MIGPGYYAKSWFLWYAIWLENFKSFYFILYYKPHLQACQTKINFDHIL